MRQKLTKISISNINQVLPSLKTYQVKLYFKKLWYIRLCKRYSVDLDILHKGISSLFPEE